MENFLWAIVAMLPIAFGIFVLRHTEAVVDRFCAGVGSDNEDETQPNFRERRGRLDVWDRSVQLTVFRGVSIGGIVVGIGMLVSVAFVRP